MFPIARLVKLALPVSAWPAYLFSNVAAPCTPMLTSYQPKFLLQSNTIAVLLPAATLPEIHTIINNHFG